MATSLPHRTRLHPDDRRPVGLRIGEGGPTLASMSDLTCSVVIRALNEADHLPALFTGLLRQSRRADEVILVDSGSTDDTVAIAEAHGSTIVHIDPSEFSFGRALNIGCRAASGDVLVFVSAHVYPVDEFWLERLMRPFEEHDDVMLVYGHQTGDARNHFSEVQLMRRWFPDRSDPDQKTPFCNNANCAVRASAWERRPYDEELTGLEDMDWAQRALDQGERLWYEAGASIVHVHEETFDRTQNRYRREAIAHRRIFHDQRMNALEAIGLCLANIVRDYLAAVPRRKLLGNVTSIPRFRFAQFYGSWQGFRDEPTASGSLKRRFYYPKGFTVPSSRNRPR